MTNELLGFWPLLVQTVIIVVAVAASYGRIKERIVVLETEHKHYQATMDRMVEKVEGISRYVAKMEPD